MFHTPLDKICCKKEELAPPFGNNWIANNAFWNSGISLIYYSDSAVYMIINNKIFFLYMFLKLKPDLLLNIVMIKDLFKRESEYPVSYINI